MTVADENRQESRAFDADVARLLHLIVHSVYSDKEVFLRELISNAADACEKLRYEAIAHPELLGDDPSLRITLSIDADKKCLSLEDNGIGMSRDELVQGLGTIAHSGTKAFMDRIEAGQAGEGASLIGQFGVGFYSAFMVADHVDVFSRRAGAEEAWQWSSDGKGTFSVAPVPLESAPHRGTRVIVHVAEEAKDYLERFRLERMVRAQSGHVPVPIAVVEKPGEKPFELVDGAALWAKPKSEISTADYTDFYRSLTGHLDEPDLTVHFLYVKRVFITDEAEILPRYLRFVRGLVDSADLPLNLSREMIQESPILMAIRKAVTSRMLTEIEKLADKEPATYAKIWDNFGAVLKEGIYEDVERRDALLALSRFKTSTSAGAWRSLKDYVASLKDNQSSIYYVAGDDIARLEASPHLEGFRARGVEVLLLTDPVDSFWVTSGASFEGKAFKSVTQGAADLTLIPRIDAKEEPPSQTDEAVTNFVAFIKETLGEAVSDVRTSDRLTDSPVCLVAPETGLDRQLEKLLAGAGRLKVTAKPILEINPRHAIVVALASLGEDDLAFKQDAAHLLFDEARVLEGERPADARMFSDRLGRLLTRSLGKQSA